MTWSSSSRRFEPALIVVPALLAASAADVAPAAAAWAAEKPVYGEWETLRRADGLPSDKVFCVLGAGPVTWAGTERGLARIEDGRIDILAADSGLPHDVVNALALSPRTGDLWIATMGGLARLSAGRIDRFDQRSSGLINDVVYAVAVQGDDVWTATAAGVSVYDTVERSWSLFNHENTLMHEPWCYSLSTDDSRVWVGVWGGGVVEHDLRTAVWKAYRDPDKEMEIDLFRDDGLIHDVITGVSRGDDVLWVGTYFGMSRYDGKRWQSWLEQDSGLPSNFINYVWADGPGVWVCTDRGLGWFDGAAWDVYTAGPPAADAGAPGDGTVRRIPESIAHDFVMGVHLDGDRIWVATAEGLSRGRRLSPAPGS